MLRLNVNHGPFWLDLIDGVRVEVLPLSTEVRMRATQAIALTGGKVVASDDADGEIEAADHGPDAITRDIVYMRALAAQAIIAWEGVGDEAGEPAPVTPENIVAFLDMHPLYQAFYIGYVLPGMKVVTEGNGSAPSPNGTSAAGPTIAGPAPESVPNAPDASTPPKPSKGG